MGTILLVETWRSVQLARSNSAFLAEATYLGAGHQLLHAWFHGGPNLRYSTYFSGAPVLYPVLAAVVDAVGGLFAARMLSLVCVLGATVLLYASASRLYGTTAGWLAAATFATVEGTLFLSATATYDSLSLALIALAAWIVIRVATTPGVRPYGAIYLAAPVLALANATKYASTLYDVVVVALAFFLVTSRFGRQEATKVAILVGSLTLAILAALLSFAGTSYDKGIAYTTVSRAFGTSSPISVAHAALTWVGALAALAAVGAAAMIVAARRGQMTWAEAAIGIVMAGAVLLAPANEARIHTIISLNKHVDFGAWFGAIGAGWVLSRLVRHRGRNWWRYTWRWLAVACFVVPLFLVGSRQAAARFRTWVNSTQFVHALRPIVAHTRGALLVDESQVPAYYLGDSVNPTRWFNTFFLSYTPPGSNRTLTGIPAYVSAIRNDRFAVVALDFGGERAVDAAVVRAIGGNPHYRFVQRVPVSDSFGNSAFVIWRLQKG
jgi:4-amino-4-deoxy-L-arabinose transferase-like glycosyltransferase